MVDKIVEEPYDVEVFKDVEVKVPVIKTIEKEIVVDKYEYVEVEKKIEVPVTK